MGAHPTPNQLHMLPVQANLFSSEHKTKQELEQENAEILEKLRDLKEVKEQAEANAASLLKKI